MEFWPENQDHLPLYAKFGTVPGRNCTHDYHDRPQSTHYPLYYGEQQDQGRESSYWTIPGSRTGGTLQEYTNWTDPRMPASSSSHFPFILDHHTQQHQDRDREWTASQRTMREFERGFLREGWQSRWEPCSPVHYNREVSSKRSDSIYRELEAWAARYSHTLPRRRRVEAELRGTSQGLLETCRTPERDGRTGTDPRVAALQQVRQSENIRESGLWDRGERLQTPTYYPLQAPAPHISHMGDIKEKTGYQRRMFSHPPVYIAPPPYNSPHKSSPVMHHCDTSWEEQGKRQTYWSQPTVTKQDVSVELQHKRKGEKEDSTKTDENKTCAELKEVKHRRQETDDIQAGSPISVLNTHMQHESMLLLHQPQRIGADQNTKTNEQTSSKIIEGRKFRLNKKTGRMTIFCLVSRIAGVTETPSLPLCISQTNTENTELEEVSKGSPGTHDKQMNLAEDVDFRVPILTQQSNTSDVTILKEKDKEKETSTSIDSDVPGDNLSNKDKTGNVSPEKTNLTDVNFRFGKQSIQPVSVKYPLWKEPSFTSRAETGGSSTCCFKARSEEGESDGLHSQEECATVHPINTEVQRLDNKKDTESEDSKDLLVIDTTCVVVKMELIPSPKKEQVQFFGYTAQTEHSAFDIQSTPSPEPNIKDVTTDKNAETKSLQLNDNPAPDPHSDLSEKRSPKYESKVSSACMPSSSVSETLEERARRILGIPLNDFVTEQQPGDATSFPDSRVEEQEDEIKPFLLKNYLHDEVRQIPGDTADGKRSKNTLEVGPTEDVLCLKESDNAKGQQTNEECEDSEGTSEKVSNMSKEKNNGSQLETDLKMSKEIKMTDNDRFETTSEDGKTVTRQGENQPVENDPLPPPVSPTKDLSNSPLLSHSDLSTLLHISESNTEGLIPQLAAFDTAENLAAHPETSSLSYTPLEQIPSILPLGSTESFPTLTPHKELSPNTPPPPLNVTYQTSEETSTITLCTVDQDRTARIIENDISGALEDFAKDMTKELMSMQQSVNDQSENPACVGQRDVTAEQQINQAAPIDLLVKTLEIPKENVTDNILQLELAKVEDVCVKENYMTEEQIQKEVRSPADLLEVTILHKGFDNDKEEDVSCFKVTYLTEEQSHMGANDDPTGLLEQTISQENTTDCHAQTQIEILQETEAQTEPLELHYEVFPSPSNVLSPSKLPCPPYMSHKSDAEPVSLLEIDIVCPSQLNHDTADTGIPETVPPLYLDSSEESLLFPSYFSSESTSNLASSSTCPSQEEGESVSLDLPHKEESQYPKSLWDAVNRIRKHTAPDSENEEEEMSELWDPDSTVDFNSRKMVFDEAGQQEVSTEGRVGEVEMGQIQQDACQEESSGCAEDDTLSFSSTSSHSSGDTVIVAEENEAELTTLDAETESKTETDEEQDESCLKEECKVEVEKLTVEVVEITETEQKQNEDIFTPRNIAVVTAEVTGCECTAAGVTK